MAKLLGSSLLSFANIAAKHTIHDDDVVDQLNHWATAGLLSALAMGTGAKQFVGNPIKCWIPAQYKKKFYQKYADSYCWISHMYNIPFTEPVPVEEEERLEFDVSFYRWVMVMFLLQAMLYKLPNIIWKEMKGYSGLNVQKVVAMIKETSMLTPEERMQKIDHAAHFIHRWLLTYTQYQFNLFARFREKFSSVLFCFGKRTGTYLTGLYMFVKILYVGNSIGQFFLLSWFLGLDYWGFGMDAMSTLFQKGKWQDHYTFPRIGLCDYKIRQMQNVQTFSVQCVLSLNLFLEKMYLLLWFWMIGLMAANIVNLTLWFVDNTVPDRNASFMFRYAKMMGIETKHDETIFRLFAFNHLRRDGIFILRMVAKNTSDLHAFDLVKALFKCFKEDLEKRDSRRNGGPPLPPMRQPSAPAEEDVGDDDTFDGNDSSEPDETRPLEKPPLE